MDTGPDFSQWWDVSVTESIGPDSDIETVTDVAGMAVYVRVLETMRNRNLWGTESFGDWDKDQMPYLMAESYTGRILARPVMVKTLLSMDEPQAWVNTIKRISKEEIGPKAPFEPPADCRNRFIKQMERPIHMRKNMGLAEPISFTNLVEPVPGRQIEAEAEQARMEEEMRQEEEEQERLRLEEEQRLAEEEAEKKRKEEEEAQ